MNNKIGFIGCGNMGEAMIKGIISSFNNSHNIYISTKTEDRQEFLKKEYNINICRTNKEVASNSDIIFLAVKPHILPAIIEEVKEVISIDTTTKKEKIIVSVAAGVTIKFLDDGFGKNTKIIRTMPNTPASVGMGMTSISPNENVTYGEAKIVTQILEGFGEVEEVSEELIHSVIGVSGSSPAYVFMFIEAMADAAVLSGMPRQQAYKFAAQAVMGSAKMVLETGTHPGKLKDMVCSPGGTTIEAVAELEKNGFRTAVISSIIKCMDKSKKMSKQ